MIVTDLAQYDLTGKDPLYKREDRRFVVFTAGQKIDFQEAVYPNSIRVYMLQADNSIVELLQGSGNQSWNYNETCIDYSAMSKGKLRYTPGSGDPAVWDSQLINCIYMQDTFISTEYTISVSYQAFEKELTAIDRDSLGPEYSPGLMRTLVHKVEELFKLRNPVEDYTADTFADMKCMSEDLTGANSANYVENEEHVVSSSDNKFVVRPQNGSFYGVSAGKPNNVVITYRPEGTTTYRTLTYNVDYEIIGINHEKTAVSFPAEGVYEFVVFKTALEGSVYLTYHAFGGEVSQADINKLKEIVWNIYQTLADKQLLTADNIHNVELIRNINYRVKLLEEAVKINQVQLFQYVPDTTGDKWADIAFISDNVWSEDAGVPVSAVGEFRIEIDALKYYLDFRLSYDTDSKDIKFSVDHISAPTFAEYGEEYFNLRILPKFRLIWNEDLNDGLMLQMSITREVTEELAIEKLTVKAVDRTGANSHWILVDNQNEVRPPVGINSLTNCVFPNGKEWISSTGNKTDAIPAHPIGYTILADNVPMSTIEAASVVYDTELEDGTLPNEGAGYVVAKPVITGTDIDPKFVTGVRFEVYDSVTQSYRYGETNDVESIPNGIRAAAMYFYDDMCVIEAALTYDNGYSLRLKSRTGTNSLDSDRFTLTRIDLLSSGLEGATLRRAGINDAISGGATSDIPMSLTRANTVVNFGRL